MGALCLDLFEFLEPECLNTLFLEILPDGGIRDKSVKSSVLLTGEDSTGG
jgi:hypothetical protein